MVEDCFHQPEDIQLIFLIFFDTFVCKSGWVDAVPKNYRQMYGKLKMNCHEFLLAQLHPSDLVDTICYLVL